MRLDFNVLWVDDQPERVASSIDSIQRRMDEEGFDFRPVQCRSLAEVTPHLTDNVFTDEVDLILVDWDLGGGVHGQDAIRAIREAIPYKDVVFYSSVTDVTVLRRLVFDNALEGIYCATRPDLVEEVIGVFDSLIKKVLDLDHTRGIVMGATSDIEFIVRDCLAALHAVLDDDGKAAMVQSALRRVEEKIKHLAKKLEKLKADPQIAAILEAHLIFSAHDGLHMLKDMLDAAPFKEKHGAYRATVVTYIQEVQPDRNKLGHQSLMPDGKPAAVVNQEGNAVSLDDMKALRRVLLNLRRDFRRLHGALKS